jgi:hypothetical protein
MLVKSLRLRKFLLTAGLLAVLLQGLWRLPVFQDYFFTDNYWESKLEAVNNEDRLIRNGLKDLKLRIVYLTWCLAHKTSHQGITADWMLHFPFSESIRSFSPRFAWHINVYLASKTKVQVQRDLKNLDALVRSIPVNIKEKFYHEYNNKLLNDNGFIQRFTAYNNQLINYDSELNKLRKE